MDSKSELDKVGSPPEQKQLRSIIDVVQTLTEKGGSRAGGIWVDKGWTSEESDAGTISVSRLTEDGEKQYPDYPLVMVRTFENTEEGRIQHKYDITKENGNLRIDKYDSVQTPEGDKEKSQWKERLDTLTSQEADEALRKLMAGLERRREEHAFQRSVGHSYVDREEAQRLIDQLSKLPSKD